jgi:carboxymethylenebutenolidase
MCDDFALADDAEWQAMRHVSRRGLGLSVVAIAAGGALASCMASGASKAGVTPTPDGTADAFFAYPAKGRHAAILIWPDILGLRDSFKDKARQLARAGYAALAVNHYYRSAKAPVLPAGASFTDSAVRAAIAPFGKALSPAT